MVTEETQLEIQVKLEMMVTGIMEMDALIHARLKLDGSVVADHQLPLTHVH
jgi:hypothetical protein